jgi:hypothetical protein
MSLRKLVVALAIVGALVAWYAFRPEKLFINQSVSEQFPTAAASNQPEVVSAGDFHGVAHETKGTATVYQGPDGKRTLRFTNFQTSNGPDVQVYLVANTDATDNDTVTRSGFLSLGALKGNIGDQNYELGADVDLTKYRAVTIWCRRFSVNFATAPLGAKM